MPTGSANEAALWPCREPVAPFVANMPASDETSIESVALAITAKEPDPVRRLKALHDWVATRLRHDRAREAAPSSATSLKSFWETHAPPRTPATAFSTQTYGPYPPAADIVFRSRVGVCGDYASLLSELGKYAGLDVKYVTGYARTWDDDVGYHAWNVAHVGDQYLMIDATWDSRPYSTEYLFVPPAIFAQSHLPDREEDLHTNTEINRVTIGAHPLMTPSFYAAHLSFIGEVGNPMFTKGPARLAIDNPEQHALVAFAFATRRTVGGAYSTCTVTPGNKTTISCLLPNPGDYQILAASAPMKNEPGSVGVPWAFVHTIEE